LSADATEARAAQRDALMGRVFGAILGAMDLYTIYLGDRLGLYRALADAGPMTTAELAVLTGTHERYVREWLEQQAAGGLLTVDDAGAPAEQRRFGLPPAHAEVLLDKESLNYLGYVARFAAALAPPLPAVVEAFRTGGGVPWSAFGADAREGQADQNRPLFLQILGREWLPAIPDVHARLLTEPPARVADVGCGAGWSSIGIALAYPTVRVDGYDLDADAIELARANAASMGVADRVAFHVRDAGDPALAGQYQLVTAFECIHDMPQPVPVLDAMRRLRAEDGAVLVVDERAGEHFEAPAGDMERLFYGFSVLCCLPVGMSETPSAQTGAVMRPGTLHGYARAAGFSGVDVLPIEHEVFRLYRLVT
jgi:2-polyprenyl-3-methyl-5-hydroxy-6-metoxy-1,4-benzoquinol methylase